MAGGLVGGGKGGKAPKHLKVRGLLARWGKVPSQIQAQARRIDRLVHHHRRGRNGFHGDVPRGGGGGPGAVRGHGNNSVDTFRQRGVGQGEMALAVRRDRAQELAAGGKLDADSRLRGSGDGQDGIVGHVVAGGRGNDRRQRRGHGDDDVFGERGDVAGGVARQQFHLVNRVVQGADVKVIGKAPAGVGGLQRRHPGRIRCPAYPSVAVAEPVTVSGRFKVWPSARLKDWMTGPAVI